VDTLRILITGASGTGTTTLGGALAQQLNCGFFDADDYYWLPAEIRVTRLRDREMRRFGRVDPAFLAWAGQYEVGKLDGRSLARHEAWLSSRRCTVLRIEGDYSTEHRLERVSAALATLPP
jgi:hypothetical protein